MFQRIFLAAGTLILSSSIVSASETQTFSVSACTSDNKLVENIFQVKTIGDRKIPAGIPSDLHKAWQATTANHSLEEVLQGTPIFGIFQASMNEVSAIHGVNVVAVSGGLKKGGVAVCSPAIPKNV